MKAQLLQWKRVTSSQRDEPTHKKPLKPVCLAIVRLRPPESTALALIEGAFKMPSFFWLWLIRIHLYMCISNYVVVVVVVVVAVVTAVEAAAAGGVVVVAAVVKKSATLQQHTCEVDEERSDSYEKR